MVIFDQATDRVGGLLREHGFRYRKSTREAEKEGKLFIHGFQFRTSRKNAYPGRIKFEVGCHSFCKSLGDMRRKYEKKIPIHEDFLFGDYLQYLITKPKDPFNFNIGVDEYRESVLLVIEKRIETDALKLFNLIDNPEQMQSHLESTGVPACLKRYDAIGDYLLFVKEMAEPGDG